MALKLKKINERANALLNLKADDDELIRNLRNLIIERDKLAEKIIGVKNEGDTLKELLGCSSREDMEHVYEEFYSRGSNDSKFDMSPEEEELLIERFSRLRNYKLQQHSGVSVRTIAEKFVIVAFLPLPNYTPPEICLLKFEKMKRKKLKLIHCYLPDVVPVDEFESVYLKENAQDVPAFIHAIHQCLWCYWIRDFHVSNIKNEGYMKDSLIYHNRGRTVISFTIHFLEKFNIEVSLRYDSSSHLPCSVQVVEMDEQVYPNELKIALAELKNSLLHHSLSSVLEVNLRNESREGSVNSGVTSSSTSLAIELFK